MSKAKQNMKLSIQITVITVVNICKILFLNQLFKTQWFPFVMSSTLNEFSDYLRELAKYI